MLLTALFMFAVIGGTLLILWSMFNDIRDRKDEVIYLKRRKK